MINDFTAVDVETTGLSPDRERIIEIGAVKYLNGKAADRFLSLINPRFKLPKRIIEITGITDDMLINAPDEKYVIARFLEFAGDDIILGHNVGFDYSFLKAAALRNGFDFNVEAIDTLYIAKKVHTEFESRTLSNMCRFYGVVNEKAHRAYHDAKAAADIYFKMAAEFYEKDNEVFKPHKMETTLKKSSPATAKQISYLTALIKQKGIDISPDYSLLTKSEASRIIDNIKSGKYGYSFPAESI